MGGEAMRFGAPPLRRAAARRAGAQGAEASERPREMAEIPSRSSACPVLACGALVACRVLDVLA